MSGCSACPICGDIYYDPPMGEGPTCVHAPSRLEPPSPDEAWVAYRAGDFAYFVPREEYEAMQSRLALAEQVVRAAQEVQDQRDKALDNHGVYLVLEAIRKHLTPALVAWKSAHAATSDRGEGDGG